MPVSCASLLTVRPSDLSDAVQHSDGVKKGLAEPYADTILIANSIRRHGGRLNLEGDKEK